MTFFMDALSMADTAGSALREWSDRDGNTVKAAYVRTEVASVILCREDGTEFKVAMKSLSEPDMQLVRLQTPPRILINMEPSVDSYTVGYLGSSGGYDYTVTYEVVEPSVLLRKTSTEPYEAQLEMEMILLGRIRDIRHRYIIIESAIIPFTFTEKNSYVYYYAGSPVDLRQIKGSWRSGIQYEGYLILIRDSRGELVAVKGSKIALEEHAAELSGVPFGTLLTDDLRVVKPRRVVPEDGYELPSLTY
jgi:hypothetical protein